MPGTAAKIIVTERQQKLLDEFRKSRTIGSGFAQRATIILLGFAGMRNEDIAPQVGLNRQQVGLWRRRLARRLGRVVRVGLAHRAEIILLAFSGLKNEDVAKKLQCERHGVGIWQYYFDQLTVIECVEKPTALREAILEVLSDLPRAGCGGKFTADQIAQILATACEPPEKSDRPISHWTPRELAEEVIKRQIVPSISVRQVGRFLKDSGTPTAQEPLLA